jgi:hypothetical protein
MPRACWTVSFIILLSSHFHTSMLDMPCAGQAADTTAFNVRCCCLDHDSHRAHANKASHIHEEYIPPIVHGGRHVMRNLLIVHGGRHARETSLLYMEEGMSRETSLLYMEEGMSRETS